MRERTIGARGLASLTIAGALLIGCGDDEPARSGQGEAGSPGEDASPPSYVSDVYSDEANWSCLPGKHGSVCSEDLDATVFHADGTLEIEEHVARQDPTVDCFYVYPTVSDDDSANSDLVPGPQEIAVTLAQAARLNRVCEVYAPIYRQITLTALLGSIPVTPEARETAYADVLDAFKHYRAGPGLDRPFVLIGHSQGAGHLKRLVEEEIDGVAEVREQLVSAFLLGSTLAVPDGADVGGDFDEIPLCRAPMDTGCAVSYATFRKTAPPPDDSLFGRSPGAGLRAACNNPAALSGGLATQKPYFGTSEMASKLDPDGPEITTPFVTFPDFLRAECVVSNGFSYLELTILADPDDPRPDDISGNLTAQWGLHLSDAQVAMGDIVDLVEAQAEAQVMR